MPLAPGTGPRDAQTILLILALIVSLATPLAAQAQEKGKVYRIGWLGSAQHVKVFGRPFLEGLRERGWVEGQHFVIEYRVLPKDQFDRLPTLATELVELKVDLIFSVLTISTHAATQATKTIPMVFTVVTDPVGDGFVTSLTRPGGNVTGVSNGLIEIGGEVLELLKEAIPETSRVAYLWNATHGRVGHQILAKMRGVAQVLGVALNPVEVREDKDFEPAFGLIRRGRHDALIVLGEPLANKHRSRIAEFALAQRLPLMAFGRRIFPEAGALMSYAPEYPPQFRRAAHLVYKILRGAEPADLPVEFPTEFDFVVNLKTANALGITIPQSVLVRANEIIE